MRLHPNSFNAFILLSSVHSTSEIPSNSSGVRCAMLSDTFSARATRLHNDANVMALGGRVIGPELAKDIVDMFLETEFSGVERHQKRIDKIAEIEKKYSK